MILDPTLNSESLRLFNEKCLEICENNWRKANLKFQPGEKAQIKVVGMYLRLIWT